MLGESHLVLFTVIYISKLFYIIYRLFSQLLDDDFELRRDLDLDSRIQSILDFKRTVSTRSNTYHIIRDKIRDKNDHES
jgi:hypothetical protein